MSEVQGASSNPPSSSPAGVEHVWVWHQQEVRPAAEVQVSVLDHSFLYGDSVYETLRTFDGRILAAPEHLDRLERSASRLSLSLPCTRSEILDALRSAATARPSGHEAGLRLMVSRGVGPLGLDIDRCHHPQLFVFGWRIAPGPHPRSESGMRAVVASVRRNSEESLDPGIKSGNFLNNILAFREARAAEADEAILLGLDGTVRECTTSNVFWVRDGRVRTPSDRGILQGITRDFVREGCRRAGIEFESGDYPVEDLRTADEIFISSTLKGVLPVAVLDGDRLGTGAVTPRVRAAYEDVLQEHLDTPSEPS